MKKKKVIIYNSVPFFVPYFAQKGIEPYPIFKEIPKFLRIFRKLFFLLNIPRTIWFGNWKEQLKTIETIIVFSNEYTEVLDYIRRNYPKIKIIIWYWNPAFIFVKANPNLLSDDHFEKWSFDKKDCQMYGMKYNTTFYFDNISLLEKKVKYDVIFLGANKGRKSSLLTLQSTMDQLGLSTYFHIVEKESSNSRYTSVFPRLNYNQYLCLVAQSTSILDFVQVGQSGLTLRPMESLFFRKKLITNDVSIIDQDFYNSRNIFVIGIDSFSELYKFIHSPYVEVSSDILLKYDVSQWISRFETTKFQQL